MKAKIMNFVDGPKEINVGDTVYVKGGQNRSSGREYKVSKVGRSLVHLDDPRAYSFYLEDGRQKTDYCSDYMYSSEEAYNTHTNKVKHQDALRRVFGDSYRVVNIKHLSLETINQIVDLVGPEFRESFERNL